MKNKVNFTVFIFVLSILLFGCTSGHEKMIRDLVAKDLEYQKAGSYHYALHVIPCEGDKNYSYHVLKVYNSESELLKDVTPQTNHYCTDDVKKMWEKLGVESFPAVVVLDHDQIVFQASDPEELRNFAKTLED